MQINNMLPILLNILNGRSPQNKAEAGPKPGMDALNRQPTEKPSETSAASATGKIGQGGAKIAAQTSTVHSLPDFLPLPLKSPHFAESSFYIKNNREEADPGSSDNILIRLKTESMETLWISLIGEDQSISVSFYTSDHSYTISLKESFPELVGDLKKLGYSAVKAAGITRAGITGCADINPGTTTAGYYLLDLEV